MTNPNDPNDNKTQPLDPNSTRILPKAASQQSTVILPAGGGNMATTRLMTVPGVVAPGAAPSTVQPGAVHPVVGQPAPGQPGAAAGGGKTEILPRANLAPGAAPTAFDPVVGWLVVVGGPGIGQSVNVRYGQNTIGRGADMRIVLDFGDQRISREAHAIIVYEDRARRFFLRDTGQANLVYHGNNVVLQTVEIKDRDLITIGDTVVMFVAMCNESFDWLAGLAANAPAKA